MIVIIIIIKPWLVYFQGIKKIPKFKSVADTKPVGQRTIIQHAKEPCCSAELRLRCAETNWDCSRFGLVVSTYQVLGQKDSSEGAYLSQGDHLHKDFYVFFSFVHCCVVCLSPGPAQYISYFYGTIQPVFAENVIKHQPPNLSTLVTAKIIVTLYIYA